MKVVLVNPPIETNYRTWYPIGIAQVAAVLLQRGIEVEIIDLIGTDLSRNEFIHRIKFEEAKYFGIGGLITAFSNVVDIARYIRDQHPDSFIFAGNTVANTIPEIILNTTEIEAVVLGEGEETVHELLLALEDKRDINQVNGIMFKDVCGNIITTGKREPVKDLDELPYPAWEYLPMENYFRNANKRYCLVSTVRGCPYRCSFCCRTFLGYKPRFRSPRSVISELLEFHGRYNISTFNFFDDLSMCKKKNLLEFCELKMQSKLSSMPWTISGRVNLIDEELSKTLKYSNCTDVGFGIESIEQDVLDSLNKGVTVEQIERALAICEKYKLYYGSSSFMIGAINETAESVRKSSAFAKKHNLRYEPHFMTPFPKTEIYDYAIKEGIIKDELEYLRKLSLQGNTDFLLVNLTKNLSDKELIDLKAENLFFPISEKPSMSFERMVKIIKTLSHPKEFVTKVHNKFKGKKTYNRYSNIWE